MTIAKRLPNILTGIIFLLISVYCSAQVRFIAIAEQQEVASDGIFKIEFIVENAASVENFRLPTLKNFRVLSGPDQSNGMSMVNGAVSKYSSVSFVLQPIKTGKISIASASAVIDGKKMKTDPLLIKVGNYRTGNNQSTPVSPFTPIPQVDEQYELMPREDIDKKIKDNIFVQLVTDKLSCYEGEPVIATYKLCSRLKSESRVTKRPSLNGFSVYDMLEPENSSPSIEKINGKSFNVHIIRKAQLYPLQSGVFELEPVELENKVRFLKRYTLNNPEKGQADQFLADNQPANWEEHNVMLANKPVSITVKPLPENKPGSFNGAVGNFSIQAEVTPKVLHANETAVLRVTINGDGNLPLINAPVINFPTGIEWFGDAAIKEAIDKRVAPIHGSKTFEYSFIPADSGFYEINPVELSFFDPVKAVYQQAQTGIITLKVLEEKKIKAADKLKNIIKKVPGKEDTTGWMWVTASVLALLVLLAAIFKARAIKKKNQLNKTVVKADTVKEEPLKASVYPFQKARDVINEEDHKQFYAALQQSLWTELSNELQLPLTRLNRNTVKSVLKQRGVEASIISDVEILGDDCEMALYTPVYTSGNRYEALARAERIIGAIRGVA